MKKNSKRPKGRPRRVESGASQLLGIRFAPSEREEIEKAAGEIKIAVFIREAAIEKARRINRTTARASADQSDDQESASSKPKKRTT